MIPVAIARQLSASLKALLVATVVLGVLYPAAILAIGLAVPGQANGSLIEVDGTVVGSSLLGQAAEGPQWFQARPSASDHAGDTSGGSNLGPNAEELAAAVSEREAALRNRQPRRPGDDPSRTRSRHPRVVWTRTSRPSTPSGRRREWRRRAASRSTRCAAPSPSTPKDRRWGSSAPSGSTSPSSTRTWRGRMPSRPVSENGTMGRGRLRIYLGAAPGVGKTVAMLDEAHRRLERGTDVVVGLVETHDRPHTAHGLAGLEVIPRRSLTHRGATFEEMDLDALLARRPAVALVDELAHTNAPGSRNEKRWQDIDELLDAGIDVISTVNIQHLESLNDAVESITGIVQRETVPDEVVRRAEQIELVDMSPEALRRRMAHGNVYRPEKVDAALSNYFRVGNLSALRELALLWLADRVDEGMGRYRADHGIQSTWPTRERVVVALSGGPEGETLLRRGCPDRLSWRRRRAAGRARLPGGRARRPRPATPRAAPPADRRAGRHLPHRERRGPRGCRARLRPRRQRLAGRHRQHSQGPVAHPALAEHDRGGDHPLGGHRRARRHPLVRRTGAAGGFPARGCRPAGCASGMPRPCSARCCSPRCSRSCPADPGLPLTVPLYLLLAVLVALLGGIGPALVGSVSSSLLLNWFFTPPVGNLTISEPANAVALVVFVAVAAAVAFVVHRSARRAEAAIAAQQESAALAELTHTLLGSTDQMSLLLDRAVDMFGAEEALVVRRVERRHARGGGVPVR